MQVLNIMFPGKVLSHFGDITGLPAHLILQHQTTSFGAISKARYTKHILPILMTQNSKFRSAFERSPRKCYKLLEYPLQWHRNSVLNNTAVTYKVSYSNAKNNKNTHAHGLYPSVLINFHNIFPLCLKMLFHLKNQQVLAHPVLQYRWRIYGL